VERQLFDWRNLKKIKIFRIYKDIYIFVPIFIDPLQIEAESLTRKTLYGVLENGFRLIFVIKTAAKE